LIALVPGLDRPENVRWDRALPAFAPAVVASHLLLVHNLDYHWIFKIDPPAWSVATEWQIYLAFPALVALWRRHGVGVAVAAAFAAGGGVAALSDVVGNPALIQLCPWYAGLFALGMAGAVAEHGRPQGGREPGRSWMLAATLGLCALILAGLAARRGTATALMMTDLFVGSAATVLIVACARRVRSGRPASRRTILRLLESRWAVGLGSFSYSLYLIHFPLLALIGRQVRSCGWGVEVRLGAMLLAAPAFCVLGAYVFHRVFERPAVPALLPGAASRRRALT
jgi:peptidoglycan/LPS O-acetylase OafA/YrhL